MTWRVAAFSWAILFALVHVYWLAGGPVGLPPDIAETRPRALMLATAIAIPLLATAGIGALIAGKLRSSRGRRLATSGVAAVAAFCFAHAIPPLASAASRAAAGSLVTTEHGRYALWLYEPNWLLGGLLFALAWRDLRRRRQSGRRKYHG